MKPIDFAKAAGLGGAALALNLALLFVLVFLYAQIIAPGQPEAFYAAAAPRIGVWSAPIAGISLLFLAALLFGLRRPARNAYLFALSVFVSYVVIDMAMGLAMAPIGELFTPPFLFALGGGLIASLAGAWLATKGRSAA